jgi:restriction system protein
MAVWKISAGPHGEYAQKFVTDGRVYLTWDGLNVNIAKLAGRPALVDLMDKRYPDMKPKAILNWVSQIWPFAHDMKKGDLVVLPLKAQRTIQIGELTGDYHFEPDGPDPYFHWRPVKWYPNPVPRDHFGQDLLFSFGAFMTICRVQRNNAEERLAAMRASGWKAESLAGASKTTGTDTDAATSGDSDYEVLVQDQIVQLINARFKGHGLTRLVNAILVAQGYTTYVSPPGSDGGADILAGAGPLGFGRPRLCVEVKSQDTPVDRPTVDKLLGAMSKFGADEGLVVAWNGFKNGVHKEMAPSYFKVRLWTQQDLLEQLFQHYDKLEVGIRSELPLKRVWMVTQQDAE